MDRAVDRLRASLVEPATRDFNYNLFQGKEATSGRVLSAVRTLPMMAKRRLVVIRDVDEMKADELNGLIPYLTKPCPESCLVLVAEKVDQRLKFFAQFKKHGETIKLEPLYDRQLPGFVRDEGRARVRFAAGVAELIADEVGSGLASWPTRSSGWRST